MKRFRKILVVDEDIKQEEEHLVKMVKQSSGIG